jgi:hypothetical protein
MVCGAVEGVKAAVAAEASGATTPPKEALPKPAIRKGSGVACCEKVSVEDSWLDREYLPELMVIFRLMHGASRKPDAELDGGTLHLGALTPGLIGKLKLIGSIRVSYAVACVLEQSMNTGGAHGPSLLSGVADRDR